MIKRLGVLALLLCLAGATPALGQTNTWTEHPNTNFNTWAVQSGVQALHESCGPSSAVGAILEAWNSGAYHKGLDLWVNLRGGGHADGCFNGVLAFVPATKQWALRVTPSDKATKMNSQNRDDTNFKVAYPDGTPSSVHSYGSIFCLEGNLPAGLEGKCVSSGGIFWSHAGLSTPQAVFIVDLMKPDALTAWTRKADRPGGYGISATWNKFRRRALKILSGDVREWDPVTDTYTLLFTAQVGNAYSQSTLALNEDGTKVYVVSPGTVGTRLRMIVYATAATTKFQTIKTTGGAGLEDITAPSLFYVGNGRLVGIGKAAVTIPAAPPATAPTTAPRLAVFTLVDDGVCGRGTAAPCAWQILTPTNPTSNLPPAPPANGMYGRSFVRGCEIWSIVNSNGNVWSYKPDFPMATCASPTVKSPPTISPPVSGETGVGNPPAGTTNVVKATNPLPSGGPLTGLQVRTWKGFPLTVLGQSKHARIVHDSKRGRMVVAGGDGTDGSGNSYTGQVVHALDLAVSATWTRLHGYCPAAGAVIPPRPDNTTWVYDPKRDQGVIFPAYFGGGPTNCPGVPDVKPPAPPTTAAPDTREYAAYLASPEYQAYVASPAYQAYASATTKRPYVFNMALNSWAVWPGPTPPSGPQKRDGTYPTAWGGDLHDHWGVLDPVTDTVYRFTNLCGVQIVPLDGSPAACIPFSYPNAPAGSWDLSNDQTAIDVQGRMIYAIARYKGALIKWSITERKIVDMIPMPAKWVRPTSEFGGGDYETHVAFDSKNRVLFIPNDVSYGGAATGTLIDATTGLNRGVYFFNVDTKAWDWEAAPSDQVVSGNILGYDATNNVFVYVGRSPNPAQYWIYRYKD